MKLSYSWLNEYVKIDDIDPSELALRLTMCTCETEEVEEIGGLEKVVVGKILEVSPHPSSDHLFVTKVDVGNEILDIVSGAPNTREDTCVPVALIGAKLPGGMRVKKAKLRGVPSFGVVCSEMELGVSEDHSGLWILNEEEGMDRALLKPGTPVENLFPVRDSIIDIDNKSLTNRPDLWGHYGFVRELGCIFGRPIKPAYLQDELDAVLGARGEGEVKVRITDPDLCSRYSAVELENIRIKRAPYLIRRRLFSLGIRPISNIVDITNYVMLFTGQPLHAFDAEKVARRSVVVRRAVKDETIHTLDGTLRDLDESTLLIADEEKGIAIAGVMGGLNSEIEEGTGRIIIEAANFNPVSIRRTAARLGFRTEASNRFEKTLDPELTIWGLTGAVSLIRKTIPGARVRSPLADAYPGTCQNPVIRLNCAWAERLLGVSVGRERIVRILSSLGFKVDESNGDDLKVGVPSFRATKDVSIPEDLVEEVGRIYGYGSIEPILPTIESAPPRRDDVLSLIADLKGRLSGDLALTEVYTYSFQADDVLDLFYDEGPFVTILNPVSAGLSRLRRSLLPGIFGILEKNSASRREISVYEIGSTFKPAADGGLPVQGTTVCGLFLREVSCSVFFEAKSATEGLVRSLGIDVRYLPFDRIGEFSGRVDLSDLGKDEVCHPGRRALLCTGESCFGVLSELNPKFLKHAGVDFHQYRVAFFEADVNMLAGLAAVTGDRVHYRPLPRYPEVALDLAIVVSEEVTVHEVSCVIGSCSSDLIEGFELFDVYRGEPLPEGKKNLAFSIRYRHPDRTLTEEEAKAVHDSIARSVKSRGWELR